MAIDLKFVTLLGLAFPYLSQVKGFWKYFDFYCKWDGKWASKLKSGTITSIGI